MQRIFVVNLKKNLQNLYQSLSLAEGKLIKSLGAQKYRNLQQAFVVAGEKMVEELLHHAVAFKLLVVTQEWAARNEPLLSELEADKVRIAPTAIQQKFSPLHTAPPVHMVLPFLPTRELQKEGWSLVLAGIQDPGNLGTIIRIADWFGIRELICSYNTVDVYNSKVVQASMGSLLRVCVHYGDLAALLRANEHRPTYAAVLQGVPLYSLPALTPGYILLGSEGKGIPAELEALASHRLSIPGKGGAESLNVGVAAGIICAYLTS